MMSSGATMSFTDLSSPTHDRKDVVQYIKLLLLLEAAMLAWPAQVRQLIDVPPVMRKVRDGEAAAAVITIPVHTPYTEALVLLYNAALHEISAGMYHLLRIKAEVGVAYNSSITNTSTTADGGEKAGHLPVAPNINAKNAFLSFQNAMTYCQWAEQLEDASVSSSSHGGLNRGCGADGTPTPAALLATAASMPYHIRMTVQHLPLKQISCIGRLFAAVSKYTYSLSSASTNGRPDVLAKLAYAASIQPLPPSTPPSSPLHYLPSLLLCAYHYHRAYRYYPADPKQVEMGRALGHLSYANSVLVECDRRCTAGGAAERNETKRAAEYGDSVTSRWRHHFWSLMRRPSSTADPDPPSTASESRGGAAVLYPDLYAIAAQQNAAALDSSDAVVPFLPFLQSMMDAVSRRLVEWRRENETVYFDKVPAVDDIRRDVPDVEEESCNSTPAVAEVFLSSPTHFFASLPSAAALREALDAQHELGKAQRTLLSRVASIQKICDELQPFSAAPPALLQSSAELKSLLADDASPSVEGACAEATAAVQRAMQAYEAAFTEWTDKGHPNDHSDRPIALPLTNAKTLLSSLQRVVEQWRQFGLSTVAISSTTLAASLLPRAEEVSEYLLQCEVLCSRVRDLSSTPPSGTVEMEEVDAVLEAGSRLMTRCIEDFGVRGCISTQQCLSCMEDLQQAVEEVTRVLSDLPAVVAQLSHATEEIYAAIATGANAAAASKREAEVRRQTKTAAPVVQAATVSSRKRYRSPEPSEASLQPSTSSSRSASFSSCVEPGRGSDAITAPRRSSTPDEPQQKRIKTAPSTVVVSNALLQRMAAHRERAKGGQSDAPPTSTSKWTWGK